MKTKMNKVTKAVEPTDRFERDLQLLEDSRCPLIPRADLIIVEVVETEVEQKTSSGLIATVDVAQEIHGKVLAAGYNVKDVAVGNLVKYQRQTGDTVVHKGVTYLVMNADKILAVIR